MRHSQTAPAQCRAECSNHPPSPSSPHHLLRSHSGETRLARSVPVCAAAAAVAMSVEYFALHSGALAVRSIYIHAGSRPSCSVQTQRRGAMTAIYLSACIGGGGGAGADSLKRTDKHTPRIVRMMLRACAPRAAAATAAREEPVCQCGLCGLSGFLRASNIADDDDDDHNDDDCVRAEARVCLWRCSRAAVKFMEEL